jgi:aryl-alcohol dehydrogenase-like predicted oxidoreductase
MSMFYQAHRPVAWVLQNDNVASAIIGASQPEQVQDNVAAASVKLDDDLMTKIDEVMDAVIERDPAKTMDSSPKTR